MFIHFDKIHEGDGQTDTQTLHESIGSACIASRGKQCGLQPQQRSVDAMPPCGLRTACISSLEDSCVIER